MKLAALTIVLVALVVSGIHPHDRATWWMEVAPVLIAVPILIATYERFPLTGLLILLPPVGRDRKRRNRRPARSEFRLGVLAQPPHQNHFVDSSRCHIPLQCSIVGL